MEPSTKKPGAASLEKSQQRLVEENLSLVDIIARQVRRALPDDVELDEMISAGREGLLQAALRFNPARGAKFRTFAYYRIRGAIFDNIRKMTYLNRSEYKHYRQSIKFLEKADVYLEERAEESSSEDLAQEAQALEDTVGDLTTIFVTSLEAAVEKGEKIPEEREQPSPEEDAIQGELRALVRTARGSLDPKEEEILRLLYDEELDLGEAARKLGISKPWASRLHGRAVQTLAKRLQKNLRPPSPGEP